MECSGGSGREKGERRKKKKKEMGKCVEEKKREKEIGIKKKKVKNEKLKLRNAVTIFSQ